MAANEKAEQTATNESTEQQQKSVQETAAKSTTAQQQTATQAVAVATTPSDKAIATIRGCVNSGLILPENYSYVNAIKSSVMVIAEMRDKEGKSPFETCTDISIRTALVDMAQKGLDVSKGQGYFKKCGNRLVFAKEYHGATTQIQRMFPDYTPNPRVIYQGDVFKYETDPETGRRRLITHEQDFANIDNDFVGAYLYIPCRDGGKDLYIMTRKMIEEAWKQSSNTYLTTHKRFIDKMVCKTIINSALTPIINASDSLSQGNTPTGMAIETAEDERDYAVTEQANAKSVNTEDVQYEEVDEQPY